MSRVRHRAGRTPVAAVAAFALAVGATLAFAWRVHHGIGFLAFGDEAGHVLGAVAIHHGDILYRDYIAAHGPVTFMLLHLWGVLFGFDDLARMRFVSALVVIAAGVSVAVSAAQSVARSAAVAAASGSARGRAALAWAVFIGGLAAFWIVQGLYLASYFTIGGSFAVIVLALQAWPPIAGGRVGVASGAIAGVAASLAIFTAIAFAPPVAILAVAGMAAGGGIAPFLAGLAVGVACNLIWLAVFGDPVGFLVFHSLTNKIDYAPYTHAGLGTALASLVPSTNPQVLVQSFAVLTLLGGLVLAPFGSTSRPVGARLSRDIRRAGALALLVLGILGFDARGLVLFQDGAFLMVAIAFFGLALAALDLPLGAIVAVGLAFVCTAELLGRHALSTPSGLTRAQLASAPHVPLGRSDDPESLRVRALTGPGDRLLALPYHPEFFTEADRLPIAKYHDYLPWEADYARHPWFGRDRDICVDLPRDMPKIIWFDDWRVWNLYAPESYMPCVLTLLHTRYRQDPKFAHLWVRRDLAGG